MPRKRPSPRSLSSGAEKQAAEEGAMVDNGRVRQGHPSPRFFTGLVIFSAWLFAPKEILFVVSRRKSGHCIIERPPLPAKSHLHFVICNQTNEKQEIKQEERDAALMEQKGQFSKGMAFWKSQAQSPEQTNVPARSGTKGSFFSAPPNL